MPSWPRAALLAVVLLLAGCAQPGEGPTTPGGTGHWQELPPFPLAPRLMAVTAWTGSEALFIGGDLSLPGCPGAADACTGPAELTRDGAAFDPAAGTWRRIADAPVPVGPLSAPAVLGDVVFLVAGGRLLSYDASADAWSTHPSPPGGLTGVPLGDVQVTAVANRVLAWRTERRAGDPPDQLYDPARHTWTAVPEDPLGPGFGRTYTATPSFVVLTDHPEVPNPGAEPSFVRGALLDPVSLTWVRRLDDSRQVGGVNWTWTGQRLVDPTPGTVDGGATNDYGRSYPLGGVFDPAAGAWGPLPNAPQPTAPGDPVTAPGGWPVQATGGRLTAVDGWIYDDAAETWTTLRPPAGAPAGPGSAVWAGGPLVVVGGIDDPGSPDAKLTDRAYLYDPYRGQDPPVAPGGEQGIGGDWDLVDGTSGGRPLPAPPTGRATLSAHANQLTGTAFCNGYGGQYRIDGDRLIVEDLAQTDMACLDPGLMEGEAAFMAVLNAPGTRFTRTADELVLENRTGRLRFRPQPPVPTAELIGTRWVLDTLIDGEVASSTVGSPAELQLSDDATFTAGTGCRPLSGTWRAAGDTVYLDYEWPEASCSRDVHHQEQQVIGVLGNGFRASIEGDRLTLTGTHGGLALAYRAT